MFRAGKTVAPSTPNPQTVSAIWRSPISSASVFPGPSHGARYGVSGAPLAPLIQDHPPDPCAGNPHPDPSLLFELRRDKKIPRAEDGFYRFAAKGTSSANQKPHCTVASLPSRILRSRFRLRAALRRTSRGMRSSLTGPFRPRKQRGQDFGLSKMRSVAYTRDLTFEL